MSTASDSSSVLPKWPGHCPDCGSPVMPVRKRVLAGASLSWAGLSLLLLSAGGLLATVGESGSWPFALLLIAMGLATGLMRLSRWQCRRCRSMYRRIPE